MANEITTFNFNGVSINVLERNGEAWFIASEVASVLEYRDAFNMVRLLDEDEKGTTHLMSRTSNGGNPNVTIINESGLYSAVLRSKKPEAKTFKKWVTSEVLPSIRKTGGYHVATGNANTDVLALIHHNEQMLNALKQTYVEKQQVEEALSIAQPKAEAYDTFIDSEGSFNMSVLASRIKVNGKAIGVQTLNKWLLRDGFITKNGKQYRALRKAIQLGVLENAPYVNKYNGFAGTQVKATSKGLIYFAKRYGDELPDVPCIEMNDSDTDTYFLH